MKTINAVPAEHVNVPTTIRQNAESKNIKVNKNWTDLTLYVLWEQSMRDMTLVESSLSFYPREILAN